MLFVPLRFLSGCKASDPEAYNGHGSMPEENVWGVFDVSSGKMFLQTNTEYIFEKHVYVRAHWSIIAGTGGNGVATLYRGDWIWKQAGERKLNGWSTRK